MDFRPLNRELRRDAHPRLVRPVPYTPSWRELVCLGAICIMAFECSQLVAFAAISPRWHEPALLLTQTELPGASTGAFPRAASM